MDYSIETIRKRDLVIAELISGSTAYGLTTPESDLDIAVVIPEVKGKTALQISEDYHSRFISDEQKPKWDGRVVDFQFFYEDDPELSGYSKIELN